MKVASIVPWTRHAALAGRREPVVFPSMFGDVDRVFEEMWRGVPTARSTAFAPNLDVRDADDAIVVTADLPGLTPEEFEVEVLEDVLTIRGERRAEETKEDEGRRWSERSYGEFERSIRLPERSVAQDATAKYDNGVLTVRVPKAAEPTPQTHKVSVSSS